MLIKAKLTAVSVCGLHIVKVLMGIKLPNYVPPAARCPYSLLIWASQCDAYFHGGMPIFTANIGIGMPIFT